MVNRARSAKGEGDQLRERLLDATESLLAEHGDARSVTVRAIVEAVGVTPPSLYLHFDRKEDLVEAAVQRRFAALGAAIAAATAEPAAAGEAARALRVGCRTYLRWAAENPGGYAVLFGARRDITPPPPDPDEPPDAGAVAFSLLSDAIAGCQLAGQARDGDAADLAAVVWAALPGIATLSALGQDVLWPPIDWMLDQVLIGIVGIPPAA